MECRDRKEAKLYARYDIGSTGSAWRNHRRRRLRRAQSQTIKIEVAGAECSCLTLGHLIEVKRAAGRPKDLEAIAELEQILEEQRQQ